jgi:D-amino peptidase
MNVSSLFGPLLCLAFAAVPVHAADAPTRKLKIFISVDMEGIAGVVTNDQLGPEGFEYERFREFMTAEALAAVNAARETGATEILVGDSHGNGQNLLIERFPPDVRIVRSWPRPLSMMEGIDATFDAVIFIGYHTSTTNTRGVRAHTQSSATFTRVALNGKEASEGSWNAAIAGELGVPVILVTGDDVAVQEVASQIGNVETATVKEAISFHAATTMTPQAAQQLIAQKTKAAIARLGDFKPYRIGKPIKVDLSFKHYQPPELLAYLRGVERTDSHSVRYTAADMAEATRFMEVVTNYNPELKP